MTRISLPTAIFVGIVAAFSDATSVLAADTQDPVIGTWTLNVAKSKFSSGQALKSQTRTYVQTGQDVTWTANSVTADGSKRTAQCTFKYDGKDYPVAGSSVYDTLALKRVNARTAAFKGKKGGKVTETGSRKVSADGKVLTVLINGTDAKGVPFKDVEVFDKQ